MTYSYYNSGSMGFFIARPFQYMMGSISRKFFDDKLMVNFSVTDPLRISIEKAYVDLANFYVDYSSWSDSRVYQLTLRYNFGKLKNNRMVGRTIDNDSRGRIKD